METARPKLPASSAFDMLASVRISWMSDDLRTTLLCFVCIVALAECVRWLQVMKGDAKQAGLKIEVAKQAQEPRALGRRAWRCIEFDCGAAGDASAK